ncbi:MAG: T9SS type A sorting domain-containing protein [Prevotellaceae bacterium]|nr:T9SS type A sorting domain-containing protein [Prevotellaceae bacterium]
MSVTRSHKSIALRSSNTTNDREILKVIAANSRYSATAVIINRSEDAELGAGVPKLFSPSGNIPEIYLLQQDYKKEIIEINANTQSVPLGLKTQVTGDTLTLSFLGLARFSPDVFIFDAKTGITQPLTATDNEFKFLNAEGDQEDRFSLLFSYGELTGTVQPEDKNIRVHLAGSRTIKASSSSADPIQSVEIYNAQGQLISSRKNLSVTAYEFNHITERGVYLVNIKTSQVSITKKIIIY